MRAQVAGVYHTVLVGSDMAVFTRSTIQLDPSAAGCPGAYSEYPRPLPGRSGAHQPLFIVDSGIIYGCLEEMAKLECPSHWEIRKILFSVPVVPTHLPPLQWVVVEVLIDL